MKWLHFVVANSSRPQYVKQKPPLVPPGLTDHEHSRLAASSALARRASRHTGSSPRDVPPRLSQCSIRSDPHFLIRHAPVTAMETYIPATLTQLLAHLDFEVPQASAGRTPWLSRRKPLQHKRRQHGSQSRVRFEFSWTHCSVRRVGFQTAKSALGTQSEEKTAASEASQNEDSDAVEGDEFVRLAWDDILGARLMTTASKPLHLPTADLLSYSTNKTYVLSLVACPPVHSAKYGAYTRRGSPCQRRIREWNFLFRGDQMEDVLKMQQVLNNLADPRAPASDSRSSSTSARTRPKPAITLTRPTRKFLVLINPMEGAGSSLREYEQKVAPLFRFANIDTNVEISVEDGHTHAMAQCLPLHHFDCVVVFGGDSTLHEVIQGLLSRPDWRQAIRQPLGVLPVRGGSNNGLVSSIAHQSHEKPELLNAAFILAKGRAQALDLTSVSNGSETRFSFLKIEWALAAEHAPIQPASGALGELRVAAALGRQACRMPTLSGRIWYLRQDVDAAQPMQYFDEHPDKDADKDADPPGQTLFASEAGRGKWTEMRGPFRSVMVSSTSHVSSSAYVAPGAQLDDGYSYLTVIGGEYSRSEVWRMLRSLETGRHLERPAVQQIGTRALKLQPARATDRLSVDGHLMAGPSLVAQVHRGLARVVALPRRPRPCQSL